VKKSKDLSTPQPSSYIAKNNINSETAGFGNSNELADDHNIKGRNYNLN
jgi:hypothetical protein